MSKRMETRLLTVMMAGGCVVLLGEVLDGDAVRSLLWLAAVLALGSFVLRARREQAREE